MYDIREWRHAFKLDPNKEISEDQLEQLCESGTDAIIIGGTDDVTLEKVLDLMARVRRYTVPCVLEISNIESITPGFDLYFIPSVLNSTDPRWIIDFHHEAIKEYGDIMNWDEIHFQGYCILNEDCKVAKLTKAKTELTPDDVAAYARLAEKMMQLPIFYLEYSGTYGDLQMVQAAKRVLDKTKLFYGGGIETLEQAKEMAQHADVIVVGNSIYTDFNKALETVKI
ncbi:heptaprenylglyceryl phosphate synthase [Robertmurraya yapensis]|uniref:Heptaprenylglyceryl phosphate synthase n=1 Tax=Bacillus yapensis TaxID=2492960 RepID=A0A431VU45_9BACI|nr:heptaprenylglyceryl phosphate synthase [Bacillus yapensis]RTR26766.1 heptaprenylglyceryl phosphate synthase [Bacillus yapensis]TKS93854.1 heptaprenylglyceryl phosphate synthase [Bacillus yapensis]